MRNVLLALLSAIIIASCGTSNGVGQLSRKERKFLLEQKTRQALADRHYTINVTTAHPLGYPTISLSTPYTLEVRGDSIISYLPYFGTAYSVPYGGGKALNFTGKITKYEDVVRKRGEHDITMEVYNEEDIYVYLLNVFESGSTSITVRSRQRTEISFLGNVDMD